MAATKTKKSKATEVAVAVAIREQQVPNGGLSAAPTAAIDPLEAMLAAVNAAAPTSSDKKDDRPQITLDKSSVTDFYEWVTTNVLFNKFKARVELVKQALVDHLFPKYVHALWEQKRQPTNPSIKVTKDGKVDISALYQVRNVWKVQGDTAADTATLLKDMGVPADAALKLVANEVDFRPETSVRSFRELAEGHKNEDGDWIPATDTEKAVAKKILEVVIKMSPEEKAVALIKDNKAKVKDGFLDRVTQYVENEEQLTSVLKVITPQNYPSHAEFAKSDSAAQQIGRLTTEAERILGVMLGVEKK